MEMLLIHSRPSWSRMQPFTFDLEEVTKAITDPIPGSKFEAAGDRERREGVGGGRMPSSLWKRMRRASLRNTYEMR